MNAPSVTAHADSSDTDLPAAKPHSVMPSTDELKAKYLGAPQRNSMQSDAADVAQDEADTALVEMEAGPLKKTVAVSKSRKKVIWSQG